MTAEEGDSISLETEEGDEELLEKLLKANEAIDTMQIASPEKHNQEEHLRQQVALVLRKLEKEIEQNKFQDILST